MNFGTTPKRPKLESGHLNVSLEGDYDEDLSFYSFPPTGKMDLPEVDEMVNERLSILEVFEELKISETGQNKNLADHLGTIRERLKQVGGGSNFVSVLHGMALSGRNALKKEARRKDHISHFLLRLYFCQPREKKTWFVSRESELLRYRLLEETVGRSTSTSKNDHSVITRLIVKNGLNYEPILLTSSKADVEIKKNASFNSIWPGSDNAPIYRILFEDALDVVRTRKAYLYHGHAYVTTHDMISIVCAKFRNELNMALSKLCSVRHYEENRILPMINTIYRHRISSARKLKVDSSGNVKEVISPDMIDGLALEHFPPCMENIHLNLRKNHHLKYGGRLHYGLFLKGIGLSLEDAIKFFRDEFIQKTAPEKFDKEYKYNIRYNYGKEGKKVDFSPYGCDKIIASVPGPGDVHGCIFKNFDLPMLRKFLDRKGVGDEVFESIKSLVEEKSYSRACALYFSVRHPGHHLGEETMSHPNSFYAESRKALARNPNREDVMTDQDIDHLIIPEETTFHDQDSLIRPEDNINCINNRDENIEPMDASETVDETLARTLDNVNTEETAVTFEQEQQVNTEMETVDNNESTDIEVTESRRVSETRVTRLETIIEPVEDEPIELSQDGQDNEPEKGEP